MISDDKIAEIRHRTDIVSVIGEFVALKRSGASFKGLCPFHGEKTPSFYVHPDRGFFHCFGCKESGDAIKFIMQIEGLSFPAAARQLGERLGIELEELDDEEARAARRARAQRQRLYDLVEAATVFFERSLTAHRYSEYAQRELEKRQIQAETASRFRLGYAPHAWDELSQFLAQRGFSTADAERVGLTAPRRSGSGSYDRFRHRLMFPITDVQGRVVAFSGRALVPVEADDGREPPAKYINSPEGPLYTKGDVLFGLHQARVAVRREDAALLCEGNFDVLALSQAGFQHVVAPLGTAFTDRQAKLLRRFVSKVAVVFDSDKAGMKAVAAAQPLLSAANLGASVISLPTGDDPDTFLRSHGPEAFQKRLDAAPPAIQFLIEAAADAAGHEPRLMAAAIERLGPVIASADSPVEARLYVEQVAKIFGVRDLEAVKRQLRRGVRAARPKRRGKTSSETAKKPPVREESQIRPSPLEGDIIAAFLDFPGLFESEDSEKVCELLTSADLRAMFTATTRLMATRGDGVSLVLDELASNPYRNWLEERLAMQTFDDHESAQNHLRRTLPRLARKHVERQMQRLDRRILAARREGDEALLESLLREKTQLFQSAGRVDLRGT